MALLKSEGRREIDELKKVQDQIAHRERREKIHHILIAGLGILLVASLLTGHLGGRCPRHRK